MNLEVNPEKFIASTENLREAREKSIDILAIQWVNKIMKEIEQNEPTFAQRIKLDWHYYITYDKYDGFPAEYKIRNKIATTLREKYKLNLDFEYDYRKSIVLDISLQ